MAIFSTSSSIEMIASSDQPYVSFGLSGVGWARPGTIDFELNKSNMAGGTSLGNNSEVMRILAMQSGVMVYTNRSVHKFFPISEPVVGFGRQDFEGIPGIMWRDAVAGTKLEQLLLDTTGNLWLIHEGQQPKKLGYQHVFKHWNSTRTFITFNAEIQGYDITNGETAYRLTEFGLSQHEQAITSQFNWVGQQIGTFDSVENGGFLIVTNTFDFGVRAIKTITGLEIGGQFTEPVFASVDWKYHNMRSFRTSPWVRVNPDGFCRIRVAGEEFRIKLQSSSNVDVELDYLNVKYQLSDKRNIRGTGHAGNDNG